MESKRQPPWSRRLALAAAGALLGIAVAGCSGGGSESSPPAGGGDPSAAKDQPSSTRYQGSGAPTGKERTRMMREDMERARGKRGPGGGP